MGTKNLQIPRPPVVPNLRFGGTTGVRVPLTGPVMFNLRRYDWRCREFFLNLSFGEASLSFM